jgi:hypothetical protein
MTKPTCVVGWQSSGPCCRSGARVLRNRPRHPFAPPSRRDGERLPQAHPVRTTPLHAACLAGVPSRCATPGQAVKRSRPISAPPASRSRSAITASLLPTPTRTTPGGFGKRPARPSWAILARLPTHRNEARADRPRTCGRTSPTRPDRPGRPIRARLPCGVLTGSAAFKFRFAGAGTRPSDASVPSPSLSVANRREQNRCEQTTGANRREQT